MEKRSKRNSVNQYTVYVIPQALHEIEHLPGHVRQRAKRAIDSLEKDPHPPGSKELRAVGDSEYALWRIRLGDWRIVYAITEADRAIDVLTVRRRPPYDYGDLGMLLTDI